MMLTMRKALFPILLLMGLWWCLPSHANDQVDDRATDFFRVDNITVEATGDSPGALRDKALEIGHAKALEALLQRFRQRYGVAITHTLDPALITALVDGVTLANEQTRANRYQATMAVRFREDLFDRYVQDGLMQTRTVRVVPVLVLPVWQTADGPVLWQARNRWLEAWQRTPLPQNGALRLMVPRGDLDDVTRVTLDAVDTLDWPGLRPIAEAYGADAVARVTAAQHPDGLHAETLVSNARDIRVLADLHFPVSEADALPFTDAVGETVALLEQQVVPVEREERPALQAIALSASLNGIEQLVALKHRLKVVPLVIRTQIVSLTRSRVDLTLTVLGTAETVLKEMTRQGLEFRPDPQRFGAYTVILDDA